MNWWQAPAIVEDHDGVLVVREDLIPGGSKIRFLPHIVGDWKEVVFGGPFCGGAPYALAVWGKATGIKVTLFYAKRNVLHWRQKAALSLGATIHEVPAGYMTVVQARARAYAADHDAFMLPLGFDIPSATDPFVDFMRTVRAATGPVDEVWCATGSGMLARCLGRAFPDATVIGVAVGLASRHDNQAMPTNVRMVESGYDFAKRARTVPTFPSCGNYEAKAWEFMKLQATTRRRLFWNVLCDEPQFGVDSMWAPQISD